MALNFSGPHEANAALGFAGVAEALLFFLAVLFIVLEALEHVYTGLLKDQHQQACHKQLTDMQPTDMSLQSEALVMGFGSGLPVRSVATGKISSSSVKRLQSVEFSILCNSSPMSKF